jgi:predicted O-methyltransferase YrrM
VVFNRENDNFTYEIDNVDELARLLAAALGLSEERVREVLRELEQDGDLRSSITRRLRSHGNRNRTAGYGRRLGWYAVARLTRPKLIVETGIHDGLGSTVLLRALQRNAADGHEGRLLAFDIRPDVGWLIEDGLRDRYDVCVGDTRQSLPREIAGRDVDMFVHDSDHSYDHETFEFETVVSHATEGAALISDNPHGSTAFTDFCVRHDLRPYVFIERPRRHIYPGAGLGLTLNELGQS